MRLYTVIIIQLMIWSGFTLAEWLSKKDLLVYKVIMFMIFFNLAILIGNYFIRSTKKTFYTTISSLGLYGFLHFMFFHIG
ncbi:hypothetical protein [Niallia sp. Krafla_26]|uniref:hypothetical protein n=1 Tax=Niallia sp. Krafla_26 TaxID=3064703 RepID=UPI003D17E8E0